MGKLNIEDIFSKLRFSSSIGFSRIVLSIFPWLFLIERWLQLFWILWSLNISKNSHKTYIESDLFQWNFNEAQFDPLPGKNVFIFIWFVILIGFLKVIQFGISMFFGDFFFDWELMIISRSPNQKFKQNFGQTTSNSISIIIWLMLENQK